MNFKKGAPTILYFSSCVYEFLYQRPQALTSALSRNGANVYYVNPMKGSHMYANIPPTTDIGMEGPDGIRIIKTPYQWVKYGRMKTKLPHFLIRNVRRKWHENFIELLRKEAQAPVIAIVVNPMNCWEVIRQLPFDKFVYDCIDSSDIFAEGKIKLFKKLEKDIIQNADLVMVTASRLGEHVKSMGPKREPLLLPNGAEIVRLQQIGETKPTHPKIAKLKKPVIGYLGAIASWIDTSLILKTAQAFPHTSIALVGPLDEAAINPRIFDEYPNISLIGQVKHDEVATCLKGFDVAVIPFKPGHIAECTDPIKAYEYMALGLPVVASHIIELKKHAGLADVAFSHEEFLELVNKRLTADTQENKTKRIAYAKEQTWDARAKKLLDALAKI